MNANCNQKIKLKTKLKGKKKKKIHLLDTYPQFKAECKWNVTAGLLSTATPLSRLQSTF